ncbi:MAG: MFS transporter [Candidatus Thorarchaeota archaeon]
MTESDEIFLDDTEKKKGFSVVLKNRDFMKLWIGQLISNIGSSIGSLALMFFAFALTGSELAMAGLAMVQVIPLVLFSGLIGVYVDRWDRKKIMIASDAVRGAVTLLFPFVGLFPSFIQPLGWLYILGFVYSTANAFFYPARSASIPKLVKRDDLVTANSLSQMTFQMVTLIFTPLGGALMAFIAPDYFLGFLIDATTFIASGFVLLTIRTSLVPEQVPDSEKSYIREIREAASLVRNNSIVSFLLLLFTSLMVAGGMLNALIVPFFQGELAFDEFYFSLILSGTSISGIAAALILGQKSSIKRPLFLMTGAMIVAGVMESFLASVPTGTFLLAFILMSTIGAVNVCIGVPNASIMQETIEDKMRGKVFSFQSVMINTAQLIGMAIAGVWAEAIGSSRPPILVGGLGILIVGIIGTIIVITTGLHGKLWKIREGLAAAKHDSSQELPFESAEDNNDSALF